MSFPEQNNAEPKLVLYPGYLSRRKSDWKLTIAGHVIQDKEITFRKRVLLRILQKAMKVSPEALASELFRERIQPFVASGEKGLRIKLQVGDEKFLLKSRTRRNGQFRGNVVLERKFALELLAQSRDTQGFIECAASIGATQKKSSGQIMVLPKKGLSIVSDIDDTIKVTEVGNVRELLANTFLRDFESIEGMAEVYQQWQKCGAMFHYVSSSPWQLFEPLVRLQVDGGFPNGSIHLRSFRLRDQMFKRVNEERRGKGGVIRLLIKNMPKRKFLLVGDSGERDPGIYRKICLRYPDKIRGLFIRQVKDRPLKAEKIFKIQNELPNIPVRVFDHAEELAVLARTLVSELEDS